MDRARQRCRPREAVRNVRVPSSPSPKRPGGDAGGRPRPSFPSRLLTMYQAHFGLRELPFGITPDTSFAFSATSHQEALNTLLVAASSGEGFTKITGEVGTGKTMLC